MSSQTLKQRVKDEPTPTATTNDNPNKRTKKLAMARRGLKTLATAEAIILSLTIFTIYIFSYQGFVKPFWYPPLWAIHLGSLSSSALIGLSAWLVWADGGFHRQPSSMPLFLAQLAMGLSWAPTVFAYGATRMGLVVCVGWFLVLYVCSSCFRQVNPIAGDLVKPCLAWIAFLGIMNYKLL